MQIFKKLLFLLTPDERIRASFLLIMIIIMALLDMIGVASILPFMTVLTNPGLIETNFFLKKLYEFFSIFGVESEKEFIFSLGVSVFLLLISSLAFKGLTNYINFRFVQMREASIGTRLMRRYLNQSYNWFLTRNSAELGKTILSEVQHIISQGIRPLMDLVANGIVAFTIITLLIIADPKLAIIVGISIGSVYLLIFYFLRKFVNQIGHKRLTNNKLRFSLINEAFGASKEVKFGRLEDVYINRFSKSAKVFAQTVASFQIISQLPRYILEAFAFGGVLLIILYFISKTGSFKSALPILSLYIFAGYRLMPSLQKIYVALTQLNFASASLDKLYFDLKNLRPINNNENQDTIFLKKKIALRNINYHYPNSKSKTLRDINLVISAKTTVGIIGTTGSGKTTLIDIILGLLDAQEGTLEVDSKIINKQNLRSWQSSIGYVPQHIFLSDDTIAANIAFGLNPKEINQDLIIKASKIANLHDFVSNELPEKYQTIVGERGVRLSGGQRQRIGIARALYYKPSFLILDEATSALDNQTEQAVMEAVYNLREDITIVIISHRLNTVKNCDKIIVLEKGEIKKDGNLMN